MGKKLLVTEASGFIGTHCILELLNNGYHVIGTVRDLDRTEQIFVTADLIPIQFHRF